MEGSFLGRTLPLSPGLNCSPRAKLASASFRSGWRWTEVLPLQTWRMAVAKVIVSPICKRLRAGTHLVLRVWRHSAEFNSAIRQIETLRYVGNRQWGEVPGWRAGDWAAGRDRTSDSQGDAPRSGGRQGRVGGGTRA